MHHQVVANHSHGSVFLLAGQEPAIAVHDNEIDLAIERAGLINAGPMNAMKDGELLREHDGELIKRGPLTGMPGALVWLCNVVWN